MVCCGITIAMSFSTFMVITSTIGVITSTIGVSTSTIGVSTSTIGVSTSTIAKCEKLETRLLHSSNASLISS